MGNSCARPLKEGGEGRITSAACGKQDEVFFIPRSWSGKGNCAEQQMTPTNPPFKAEVVKKRDMADRINNRKLRLRWIGGGREGEGSGNRRHMTDVFPAL